MPSDAMGAMLCQPESRGTSVLFCQNTHAGSGRRGGWQRDSRATRMDGDVREGRRTRAGTVEMKSGRGRVLPA